MRLLVLLFILGSGFAFGQSASDDFNRGTGAQALGANWTILGTDGDPGTYDNSLVMGNNGSAVTAKWNATVFTADQTSELTMSDAGANGQGGVAARIGTNVSAYYCMWDPAGAQVLAGRYNAGTNTALASQAATFTTQKLRIEVSGTAPVTIKCFQDTTQLISVTDSSGSKLTSGSPGIISRNYHNGVYDSWAGNSLGSGGGSVTRIVPPIIFW